MTCNEVSELMSAGIDGELEHHMLPEFTTHIDECRSCRNEYELERMTKNVIQRSVASAKTPAAMVATIREIIASESQSELTQKGLFGRFIPRPARAAMYAFGAVGIVLLLMIIIPGNAHHSHAQPNDANIVHQTYNNFDKVLDKSFATNVKNDDPSALTGTLGKCRCNLHMPMLKQCKYINGIHSFYNRDHIAEFVFTRNNDPVYVYEAKLQDILNGGKPRIDSNILNELLRTGWYFENHQHDCSLILKLEDSTIYCTVADMSKDQLLAILK